MTRARLWHDMTPCPHLKEQPLSSLGLSSHRKALQKTLIIPQNQLKAVKSYANLSARLIRHQHIVVFSQVRSAPPLHSSRRVADLLRQDEPAPKPLSS